MIQVPLKDIIVKICSKSGMSEDEVHKKITEKVNLLYGLVSEEGAAHIIANELGIKIFEVAGELKIKDILLGMRSVDTVGKVIRKYELREFNTEKRKGKVANLMLGDETGSARVVFWNDRTNDFEQIKEGDVIRIKNAYVKDNAGRRELHLGDNSHVIINPANTAITTRERKEYDRKHISEIADGMTAEIMGTIVQVFDLRFFEMCPRCNKRLRLKNELFECDEHGAQKPVFNYILNVYLDDGTSNIRVNFWKQQAQRILKMTDEQVQGFINQPGDEYKNKLLGEQIKVLGTAKNNMMNRLEFTADVVFTELNPEHEIEMLEHEKEVVHETKPVASQTPVKSTDNDDEFEISEDFLE